jgi:hypothetical protein
MLDEAIGSYFPLFLSERPDLVPVFDGFVYYPNTVSLYHRTLFGLPPLLGGYEYTTYNMNKRSSELMKDKNNEALLLLPELFTQNGYTAAVTDMPYVNYEGSMDPGFFSDRGIKAQNIQGLYDDKFIHEVLGLSEYTESIQLEALLRRNFLLFAILETSIHSLRDFIYQNGNYWSMTDYGLDGGVPRELFSSYAALYYLGDSTAIGEGPPSLSIMISNLTHDQSYLQYPDYTIEEKITNRGSHNPFANDSSFKHFHVNSAAYMLLAKWFAMLRNEHVWDNTRIIIVSDHGDGGINHPRFNSFQNNHVLPYNPILLVKDFDAQDALEVNDAFMTNADVPLIALEGVVQNKTNPFTGKILAPDKEDGVYIYTEGYTNPEVYSGTICLDDNSKFFHVRDSIYESENWSELRYRDFRDTK